MLMDLSNWFCIFVYLSERHFNYFEIELSDNLVSTIMFLLIELMIKTQFDFLVWFPAFKKLHEQWALN